MSVGVGSPETTYSLLIDTGAYGLQFVGFLFASMNPGSSNTWVGAHKAYNPSRTSRSTGNTVVRPKLILGIDSRLMV